MGLQVKSQNAKIEFEVRFSQRVLTFSFNSIIIMSNNTTLKFFSSKNNDNCLFQQTNRDD